MNDTFFLSSQNHSTFPVASRRSAPESQDDVGQREGQVRYADEVGRVYQLLLCSL